MTGRNGGYDMKKLYIAYGSNLNLSQMAVRCPSAKIYAKGMLNNWKLVYRGSKDNAHATIIRKKGCIVPVLVWEIQESDERRLDVYEGYPYYYYKRDIMVNIETGKRKAMVYIMNESNNPGKPSSKYVKTIYQGYIDNNMDIKFLMQSLEYNNSEY